MKMVPIASLRKRKGLSQEALAETCGLSLRAVQRIEAGETYPRPHTIKVLSQALGVTVTDLADTIKTTSPSAAKDVLPLLRVINFSTMIGLVIPTANVLVPMFLARHHESLKKEPSYKMIISFQAMWSLFTLLVVVFTPLFLRLFTQTVAFGKLPPPALLAYSVMILLNVYFTLKSAIQLRTGAALYGWVPPLF